MKIPIMMKAHKVRVTTLFSFIIEGFGSGWVSDFVNGSEGDRGDGRIFGMGGLVTFGIASFCLVGRRAGTVE
jgi:hypothetical protein